MKIYNGKLVSVVKSDGAWSLIQGVGLGYQWVSSSDLLDYSPVGL